MIEIADIITEFGAYYKKGSQNMKNLQAAIFTPSETDALFRLIPTNDTKEDNAFVDISDVLQGFQDDFTPAGDTTFTPRSIILEQMKIDLKENPSKIEKSWLGFLAGPGVDRSQWPLIRYWLEQLVIPKAVEQWEEKAVYSGVKGVLTPGTVLPIHQAVDGIKKQFNVAIAAGDLTPLTLGAVPTDPVDFVDYIEAFVKMIHPKYHTMLQTIVMSRTLRNRFREGMRQKYNMNYSQADLNTVMDYDITVTGVQSHEGSTKIWTTVKGNAVRLEKRGKDQNTFEIEKVDRSVKAYTDFWKVCSFSYWQLLFTNDVELS
jgi:hypothetical protein